MPARALPLRSARAILVALVLGIVLFTGAVVFLRLYTGREMNPAVGRLLLVVIGGLAVTNTVVYSLLRRTFVARVQGGKGEALELLEQDLVPPQLFSLALIGAALAEGVGLLGVIAVLLGGPWYALAAPALAAVLIAALLPTRERLERLVRGVV